MYQTVNTFKQPIMSYKDYLLSASSEEEIDLDNGWGWFLYLDTCEDLSIKQNIIRKDNKQVSILPTISEVYTRKSYTNLYDKYYLYESNEGSSKKINKSHSSGSSWMVHATCLISLVCIFIII